MQRIYEDGEINALMLDGSDVAKAIELFYEGVDWRESVYSIYRNQFKESIDISKVWIYYDKI